MKDQELPSSSNRENGGVEYCMPHLLLSYGMSGRMYKTIEVAPTVYNRSVMNEKKLSTLWPLRVKKRGVRLLLAIMVIYSTQEELKDASAPLKKNMWSIPATKLSNDWLIQFSSYSSTPRRWIGKAEGSLNSPDTNSTPISQTTG